MVLGFGVEDLGLGTHEGFHLSQPGIRICIQSWALSSALLSTLPTKTIYLENLASPISC